MKLVPVAALASFIAGVVVAAALALNGMSLTVVVSAFVAEFIFCFFCCIAGVKGIPALVSWHLHKQHERRAS